MISRLPDELFSKFKKENLKFWHFANWPSLGHHFLFFWFTKSADPNFSKTGMKIKWLLLIIIFIFFADPEVLFVQKLKKWFTSCIL